MLMETKHGSTVGCDLYDIVAMEVKIQEVMVSGPNGGVMGR